MIDDEIQLEFEFVIVGIVFVSKSDHAIVVSLDRVSQLLWSVKDS